MGRAPASSRVLEGGLNKGPWTEEEDAILTAFIKANGEGNWRTLPKLAGLQRCRKSCRLRWMNYLRPDLKRGNFSSDEDELIVKLHSLLGNRWSLIAGRIPGRTDNEIKNYWNSRLRRKLNTTHRGVLTQAVEATPLSFSDAVMASLVDEMKVEQTAIASSSQPSTSHLLHTASFASESIFSKTGEAVPSIFPGDFADDLVPMIFPDYGRFHSTGESTPSEPCSSDGTCRDDCSDHQSLEAGYYSTWTPSTTAASLDDSELVKDDSTVAESESKHHETYAYSPESVLTFLPQALDSGDDDLDLSPSDFASTSDLDHRETSFQSFLQSIPMSPLNKSMATFPVPWPAVYSGDGSFWS